MLETDAVDQEPKYSSSAQPTHPAALARAVRQRRAELRLSQEEVRAASGLSVTTISKIEAGEPDLAVQRATLRRLDGALDWPVGTCEGFLWGRHGAVAAPTRAAALVDEALTSGDRAAAIDELAALVAAQLRSEQRESVVSVAGLPPDVVQAFEAFIVAIRNALAHGL